MALSWLALACKRSGPVKVRAQPVRSLLSAQELVYQLVPLVPARPG